MVADSYAAAIYGSIVAAAFLTALHEEHATSIESALSLLATMAVFWLAHVWSQIIGERIEGGSRFAPHVALRVARTEWPLIEAAFGPTIVLLLGWAGIISDGRAVTVALVVCLIQLVTWGFVAGRRAYDRRSDAVLSAIVNGLLGLALVALETVVLH